MMMAEQLAVLLVEVMKVFSRYWLEIVDLPPDDAGPA